MIFFDTTKMGAARHRSGLTRIASRVLAELGADATPVAWEAARRNFVLVATGQPPPWTAADWFFTVELFSEAERPGLWDFLRQPPCRLGAMFHDAIPVRWPHIVWPQSVQRHPEYMKMLARFDRAWAISAATRAEFESFWRWQNAAPRVRVEVIALGADFDGMEREAGAPAAGERPLLLTVGIVEPRKNQLLLLEVAEKLWREGVDFDWHVAGRVNPHFGAPIVARFRDLQARERRFRFHEAPDDRALAALYRRARAVVLPTIAEGCGLPLLEALWRGVPCVCSDLPVLRENADGGGCVVAQVNDLADWSEKLRRIVGDEAEIGRLRQEARTRPLPRWRDTAETLRRGLPSGG